MTWLTIQEPTNSNVYWAVAKAEMEAGDHMEGVARDLAVALQAVITEGLGIGCTEEAHREDIMKEIRYLLGWTNDKSHRNESIIVEGDC